MASEGKSLSSISTRAGSIYLADPALLIQPTDMNARRFQADEVVGMVDEFLNPAIGQLQPIGVRQTKDGPAVVYGFKRLTAALEINEHKLYKRPTAVHLNGEPFRIACISVTAGVEDKAQADGAIFVKSIVENLSRKSTTPMDDAYNIDRLLTEFGKTREQVKEIYKDRSDSWISRTLSLLKLDAKDQKRVHNGELTYSAAVELAASLADADAETVQEVQEAVQQAQQEKGGDLNREEMKQVTRTARKKAEAKAEKAQAAEGGEEKPKRKKKRGRPQKEGPSGRTLKQVRVFFTELAELEDEENDADGTTAALGKQFLKFMDGTYTNRAMTKIVMRYGALVE